MLREAAAKSFELDLQMFSQVNKAPVVMVRLCKVFQHWLWHEGGVSSGPYLHRMVSGEKKPLLSLLQALLSPSKPRTMALVTTRHNHLGSWEQSNEDKICRGIFGS